jgi:iron complex outermembrane receptor protein
MLIGAALACLAAPSVRADATQEERATWRKAADNKIYAQKLVNDLMAAHPELLVVGLHGVAPGATEERMIASNLDRVGKKDDDDDVGVSTEHKTICAPNLKETNKFEVLMPLKDATGSVLDAAVGFVFKYKAGDDEVKMHALAVSLRDELAGRLPSYADLFRPEK